MNNIYIYILFFILIIIVVVIKKSGKKKSKDSNYPYEKRGALFTKAERSFLGVLNQAVGDKAQIFGKVRVADVIKPKKGMQRGEWQSAFNKISAKHFDYLLCDPKDITVLCAIELNDSSHNSKKSQKRDEFLEGVCKASGIPLIQIEAKATYKINEIRAEIQEYLPKENEINIITDKRK